MSPQEFSAWLDEHYGELVAVARRLVNNPEDAAEVVNAAVARVLSNGRLGEVRSPWSWLVGAVRSQAEHSRRSTKRKTALPGSIKGERGNKPGANPDEIRRKLRKLTLEQDVERWMQRQYLKRLETERNLTEMDGYGRKTKPGGGDDDGVVLDRKFTVRFPHDGLCEPCEQEDAAS